MEVRADFKSVEELLQRVLVLARQLREFNSGEWVHLRNREDFDAVYQLPEPLPRVFEQIYVQGRLFAGDLAYTLGDFNYAGDYPTFQSFVDTVDSDAREASASLRKAVEEADARHSTSPRSFYSVSEMLRVSRQQLAIGEAISAWAQQARATRLYREEAAGADGTIPRRGRSRWRRRWLLTFRQIIIAVVASVLAALVVAAIATVL